MPDRTSDPIESPLDAEGKGDARSEDKAEAGGPSKPVLYNPLQICRITHQPFKFMPISNLISLIAVVAALALAAATNPSPDKHRVQIKAAVAERSPVAGMLGVGSLTAFVSNYHSVGVGSYTVANERIVSIGMFGTVFVL